VRETSKLITANWTSRRNTRSALGTPAAGTNTSTVGSESVSALPLHSLLYALLMLCNLCFRKA
jgi:hypothetical protein